MRYYRMIIVSEVLESPLMISKPYQTATIETMNFKCVSHFGEVLGAPRFYRLNRTGLVRNRIIM